MEIENFLLNCICGLLNNVYVKLNISNKLKDKYINFVLLTLKTNSNHHISNKSNWVKNLTSLTPPKDIIDIVALGPNYSTYKKPSKHQIINIIMNLE